MEQHPQIRAMFVERLAAQPERSIREAKRLVNLWQLYERVLADQAPIAEPSALITRSRRLVVLAEIVTRWPAIQYELHRPVNGQRALEVMTVCADDDERWTECVEALGITTKMHRTAMTELRSLLREYDGAAIAELAGRLL